MAPDPRAVSIPESVIWTEFKSKDKPVRGIVCVPIETGGFPEVTVKVTPVKEEEGRGTGSLYITWILFNNIKFY